MRRNKISIGMLSGLVAVVLAGVEYREGIAGPLSPQDSIQKMKFPEDLKVELVASEPQVVDPVAIAFDEDLKLWVVEMRDYPNGPGPGEKPKSRIKVLLDQDQDGYYETAHTFADELLFATGLQPWKGGVIVTLAGEVAWLKDTDGDFKADIYETWFQGFSQDNPQLRANHPTFGPDNWIYIANGLRGGKVVAVKPEWAAEPVDISGKDFRFDPISGKYEAITGTGQFGLTFDHLGNRFICSNRNPCMQVIVEDRYLKRNPHLAVQRPLHDVAPAGEASRIFPISRAWTTSNLHAGQFTAACGVTFHQGSGLPISYRNNFYVCDPTGNLVHRAVPDSGAVLVNSKPGREGVEFLASPDEWFRPVNLSNGPDGALYLVDMYRAVIEHPRWVPAELKDRRDLLYGNDLGRIYRIVDSQRGEQSALELTQRQIALKNAGQELRAAEHHPWRAQVTRRLLIERGARELSRQLLAEAVGNKANAPGDGISSSQIAACLAVAEGLKTLTPETLEELFHLESSRRETSPSADYLSPGPEALSTAIVMAEPFLRSDRGLVERLAALTHTPFLRFRVALALGEAPRSAVSTECLADIAVRDAASEPHRTAVLSSSAGSEVRLLEKILTRAEAEKSWGRAGIRELMSEVARVIGARKKPEEIATVRKLIADSVALGPEANVEADELARRRLEMATFRGLVSAGGHQPIDLVGQPPPETRSSLRLLFGSAAWLARNQDLDREVRLEALATLGTGYARVQGQTSTLKRIFSESTDSALRSAALEGLARMRQSDLGKTLLQAWPQAGPSMRRQLLNAFLATPGAAEVLATEVLAERIAAADLTPAHRTRLFRILKGETRTALQKALAEAAPEDRREVVSRYQSSLKLDGEPGNGQKLFEKNCSTCHRIGRLGVNVAPDISDSRTKTPAQLLEAILDPNRAVDANYFSYSLITDSGKVYAGIIAAETANSVTLKLQEGRTITVLRSEIDELRNTGVSLMPVGLEKNLSPRQMADLISFIKNWRYLDGRTPLKSSTSAR